VSFVEQDALAQATFAAGPFLAALVPSYIATAAQGLGPNTVAGGAATVNLGLPKYPIRRDFIVNLFHSTSNAGDQVTNARIAVAFGTLEDLLAAF